MPKNIEYLIAAYGIAGVILFVYTLRMLIKLRQITQKLQNLNEEQ